MAATQPAQYADLLARLAELQDLGKIGSVLNWDMQVLMPPRGAAARAEQTATLGRIAHERATSPELGRLLDSLRPYEEAMPYDSDEASIIRVTRRDYDKARKVPADLRVDMARASSLAHHAWVEARKASDFKGFIPHLQKNIDLRLKYIECFDETPSPYDVLLDDYERGMQTSEVASIFAELKRALVPLIAAVARRADRVSDACLHGQFPLDRQREFCLDIVRRFGFRDDSWRLDPTVHPFATGSAQNDIRITTRYYDDFINPALFGTMHECGHGLYENGVSPALERTPLSRGASLGMHESQSRMWENLVGRSRPFWRYFFPRIQQAFPDAFGAVSAETFYGAVNKVQPSLIRVEADELTYSLHIILRFELEQEMIDGRVALKDLPEIWNARMKSYLGIDVPSDADGVLQDVHWSSGYIGYFPTYALGTIIASQIWERVQAAMPDIEAQFERGEFMALREWLRDNLHRHGRKFTPKETLAKVVGHDRIDVGPYIRYLTGKFSDIYGIPAGELGS